jgi:mono/diheme cytochrome c family protein
MKTMVLRLLVMLIILLIPFASTHTSTMLYAGLSNSGKSDVKATSEQLGKGDQIFSSSCRVCHVNGGNVINPSLPLRGSQKLSDFKTFLSFIRNPLMPDGSRGAMPSFSESQISDKDAENLYIYFVSKNGMNLMKRSSDK